MLHVDRFLSSHAVPKETLQLVGAVALMLASNHFCKLPHQDGERPSHEGQPAALNHADDIVYWTDSTYTTHEVVHREARLLDGFPHPHPHPLPHPHQVFDMEARLLYGFEIGS